MKKIVFCLTMCFIGCANAMERENYDELRKQYSIPEQYEIRRVFEHTIRKFDLKERATGKRYIGWYDQAKQEFVVEEQRVFMGH